MAVNKLITTVNYTAGAGRDIRYIVIHYVGALGGAEDNCRYYASRYIGASAHYFVGHGGEVWQSVEDRDIAWHCGAPAYKHPDCRNSNSIGVELCARKRDTGTLGAQDTDWYFEPATVQSALQLARELMGKYGIPAGNVLRHYDVTGKCCPNPFVLDGKPWEDFKAALATAGLTQIAGKPQATAQQMADYLTSKNPDAGAWALEHAKLYLQYGEAEGIRGDIAWAQRCLETGHDLYKGSAVTPDQHNYGGFGVTKNGEKGESFPDPATGILVHIQHLKAYAGAEPLSLPCADPRFKYVRRGCSPYVEWLGQKENPANEGKAKREWVGWAAGKNYGSKILSILGRILRMPVWETDDAGESGGTPGEASMPGAGQQPLQQEDGDNGSFMVYTTTDILRIRQGPGTEYGIAGRIVETEGKKKKYTIVEEQAGWGRLKSGAGWISMWYTRRAG